MNGTTRTYAQRGEAFTASTVGDHLCPVDDEPVGIHPDLTACGHPSDVTAAQIIAAARDGWPGLEAVTMQTGGGTATVYLGPWDGDPTGDGGRFAYAVGPGSYDWGEPSRSLFSYGDLSAGPDDDGEGPFVPVESAEDLRAYFATQRRVAAMVDFRGPTDLEAVGEDAAAALETLPEDGSGTYTEALACYRYAEGGSIPPAVLCGECIRFAGSWIDTRAVGARTAARCDGCGRDGAPARWSEANRAAAYWRALVLAFEPERERHDRPGMLSPVGPYLRRVRALDDGARWAAIAALRSLRG